MHERCKNSLTNALIRICHAHKRVFVHEFVHRRSSCERAFNDETCYAHLCDHEFSRCIYKHRKYKFISDEL
jgi:hypothetical protein